MAASSSTRLFRFCSLLMSALFAYSASVQLNDHDWYLWFPLYVGACLVNLVNCTPSSKTTIMQVSKWTLCLGMFLFFKVVVEGLVNRVAGFWSLDLSERVVREKAGSGLVVVSMILHLSASDSLIINHQNIPRRKKQVPCLIEYGMAMLLIFSFGLPFIFFVVQHGQMKFDNIKE